MRGSCENVVGSASCFGGGFCYFIVVVVVSVVVLIIFYARHLSLSSAKQLER